MINFAEDSTTTTSTTTATYNFYETQRQVYQGSVSPSNLLATSIRCYNGNYATCSTATVGSPITRTDIYSELPNTSIRLSEVRYNASELVTDDKEYAYGVTLGAPPDSGHVVRDTVVAYAALGNGIVDHPSQVAVYDGSNHLLSKTSYSYDESAYPVQPTTGTPQHATISGSRGNLTTITYYSTGSATLLKHFQNYDTGTPYKSWDVNGASATYTTYAYDTTPQGNTTKSCGNSFPTKITTPPTPNASAGLSVTTAWDCTGGVATSTTDPNGNSVSTSYSDPNFWRPASAQDALLNTINFTYTAAGSGNPASVESWMKFNSNSSISEQLTTVDGFGRVQYSQQQEGVGSGYYDSTQITYDSLGRPYQSTMPYVAGAGQGSTSAAKTTASYDALGRVTQVQDGGTGYMSFSYSQNDVLQINGPAPSGEHLKQKQLEYDGLGRLISVCEITAGTTLSPSGNCGQQTALPSPPGAGYLTTYTYGVNGSNFPTLTVAQNAQPGSSGQQTRTYVYDLVGRLTQETNPETGNLSPGTTNYTFDSDSSGICAGTYNGDLVKKVDNRGNTTCYTYDSLHRVQTITYTSSSPDYANTAAKTFVYDAATYGSTVMSNAMGRLAEAYTGSSSKVTDEFFSYSKRGELTDTYQYTPNSGTPYYHTNAGFWANGAVSALALISPANLLPSQAIGVDTEGRLSSVTANSSQNSNVVGSTVYDLTNYKTTVNFGSGDSDVFTLDPKTGRLTNYTFNVGSNSDVGALTWNANGSLSSLHITDTVPTTTDSQTCNYAHDDMARIASVNCGNSIWRQNFSYDAFGNISKDSTGYTGLTFAALYSTTTNQITSLPGKTPTYDGDGRLTYDTVSNYTWDADSKLHTVDTSPLTTVTYDALGRMVEKQVGTAYTQIVYSPLGGKLAVMSGQSLQKGFVPLPTGATAVYTSSGLAYYRHTDHLGSSRLATTPNRTLYSATAYAPFGELYPQPSPTDVSFAGDDQDTVSGMYDTSFRRQMPVQGRWLTPDPAGLGAVNPGNPQTWNRYAYVINRPLIYTDQLGLDVDECDPEVEDCGGGGGGGSDPGGGGGSDPGGVLGGDPGGGGGLPPGNPGGDCGGPCTPFSFSFQVGAGLCSVSVTYSTVDSNGASWSQPNFSAPACYVPDNTGNNGGTPSWTWAFIKSFLTFAGGPHNKPTCAGQTLRSIGNDLTGGFLTDQTVETSLKAASIYQAGYALKYAANQTNTLGGTGLICPQCSSVFRGIMSDAELLGKASEVVPLVTTSYAAVTSIPEVKAQAQNGQCAAAFPVF